VAVAEHAAGFSRERVLTASFTLPAYRYGQDQRRTGWSRRQFAFYNELELRLNALPGTVAAAITDSLPPGAATRTVPYVALARPGGNSTDPGMSGSVKWRYVSPGYFEALGTRITRGRGFSEEDRAPGVRNVVVNESLARRLTGDDGDPVGKRMGAATVIGVAADSRNAGLERSVDPEFYQVRKSTGDGVPGSGDDAWWRRASVVVRSNLAARYAEETLRAAIRSIDPAVPVEIKTMDAQVGAFLTRPRFQTSLLLLFALTGLALAGIGLYGLISFLVVERTREIGIRIALGATPRHVAGLVVSNAVRWTAVGTVLGLAASLSVLRVLKGLLYQVNITDVRVFAGAVAVLVAVAILAAWIPAYRASRTDAVIALRHD
jgi:putative ABC transport system permease protein